MITRSETDTGRILVPEIAPRFAVQFGPYEDQVEMTFPGEKPVGGASDIPLTPGLNFSQDATPAAPLVP